jgi:polysaccharide pyruvyl transferase WcaK-like protein
MRRKVLIFGAYGEGNIGDDLLLDTIVSWLNEKGVSEDIYIAADHPDYLRQLYPKYNVISKICARYFEADLIILGGGTQFFSFNGGGAKKSNKLKTIFSVFRKEPKVMIQLLKRLVNRKSDQRKIALGLGLGPFEEKGSENVVRSQLSNFDKVYCRDIFSFELCQKFNINSALVADICFSRFFSDKYLMLHTFVCTEKPSIGIVLRDWSHNSVGDSINNKIATWIEDNMQNYDISIFIFSHIKDHKLLRKFREDFSLEIHVWDPNTDTFQNYLDKIANMDLLITSRFHAGVFGANFGIPTICLNLDPKLYYLTKMIDSFYLLEAEQELTDLNTLVDYVFKNYSDIQSNIINSVKSIASKSDAQFDDANYYL